MSMYGSRGAMLGSGSFLDGYEVGSKRPRMMDSNPYFAVNSSSGYQSSYGSSYGGRESSYGVGLGGYGGGSSGNIYSFPVVRLRGLPFNCTDLDIYRFFTGLDVVDCLLTNKNGRFSGEAFVVFASPMQSEFALQRDRQNMGRRYVEVFRCKKQDYYHAIASEVNEYRHGSPPAPVKKSYDDKDQMEYAEILKLRGLPFSATKADIIEFFGEFELTEDNVHIALRGDGKATGEAYVEFTSAEEAKKAMNKDKMMIGSRYVELFPSTPEEARRAESRSRQ